VITLVKCYAFFEDEIEVNGKEEKEVYLNDALEEVIEGLEEG